MNRVVVLVAAVLVALTGACTKKESRPSEGQGRSAMANGPTGQVGNAAVQVFGSVHEIMMEGRTEGRVQLASVATAPGAYGLGAIGELRGEVTVVAGEAWLAYPDGSDRVRVESTRATQESAGLLVLADVPGWVSIPIGDDVAHQDIGDRVAQLARRTGWDGEGALPFLIEGAVRSLSWHVIDGSRMRPGHHGHAAHLESAVRGRIEGGTPMLVGFYSTQHQGVFTHHDTSVHIHFVDRERRLSGHVDDVVVAAGAVLKLPAATINREGQ